MKHIKGLISIGSADLIGLVAAASFWFYLATEINPSEYGEISFFIGIATIGSSLATIGTSNTITVFKAKKENISTITVISLIGSVIGATILFFIFNRVDLVLFLIGVTIFTIGYSTNLGKKEYKKYAIYILAQKGLVAIFGILFYHLFGTEGIILGISLSFFAYIPIIVEILKEKINLNFLRGNRSFISFNYIHMISNVFDRQIDKIIIPLFLSFTVLGEYSLGMQILTVLLFLPNIITKYLLPESASRQYDKGLIRKTIIITIGISLFGIIVLPPIIPIVFEEYVNTTNMIMILSLAVIPTMITRLYFVKFSAVKKAKHTLFGSIISLFVMILGIVLFGEIFDGVGIAIAYLLSITAVTIYYIIFNRKMESLGEFNDIKQN
ncbi:MAG: hypothetical protein H8E89_06895 [Candidatus Nitrosopelagicus sp.]|nr:hypothetical protein [Candidatus Nitrosopelagicus sp.]